MNSSNIEFTRYQPEYGLELVKMWRQSFQEAMNLEKHNRFEELEGQLDYFSSIDLQSILVAIDQSNSRIVAFRVLNSSELDHLYVDVDYQGLGLGSALLDGAKQNSPEGLELYTFQKNLRAQQFYESHGFFEVQRGFADSSTNPWAKSKEDLADIKYRWVPDDHLSDI